MYSSAIAKKTEICNFKTISMQFSSHCNQIIFQIMWGTHQQPWHHHYVFFVIIIITYKIRYIFDVTTKNMHIKHYFSYLHITSVGLKTHPTFPLKDTIYSFRCFHARIQCYHSRQSHKHQDRESQKRRSCEQSYDRWSQQ